MTSLPSAATSGLSRVFGLSESGLNSFCRLLADTRGPEGPGSLLPHPSLYCSCILKSGIRCKPWESSSLFLQQSLLPSVAHRFSLAPLLPGSPAWLWGPFPSSRRAAFQPRERERVCVRACVYVGRVCTCVCMACVSGCPCAPLLCLFDRSAVLRPETCGGSVSNRLLAIWPGDT